LKSKALKQFIFTKINPIMNTIIKRFLTTKPIKIERFAFYVHNSDLIKYEKPFSADLRFVSNDRMKHVSFEANTYEELKKKISDNDDFKNCDDKIKSFLNNFS
jgi:hypothetical protein